MKETLAVGDVWRSANINQVFVVDGGEGTLAGLLGWSDQRFVGYRAKRKGDGRMSLVALTAKPKDYPYDYVLYD